MLIDLKSALDLGIILWNKHSAKYRGLHRFWFIKTTIFLYSALANYTYLGTIWVFSLEESLMLSTVVLSLETICAFINQGTITIHPAKNLSQTFGIFEKL